MVKHIDQVQAHVKEPPLEKIFFWTAWLYGIDLSR